MMSDDIKSGKKIAKQKLSGGYLQYRQMRNV